MALIALGLTPFIIAATLVSTSADNSTRTQNNDGVLEGEADLLAADVIANFKTVQSFGSDNIILEKYKSFNEKAF